ncbi:MAG: peptidoglycan-binding domain-containing protein [Roseburia hominis]
MKNLYQGDRGILVSYMQLALKRAGYTLLVDGIFGTNTCQALADFCRPTAYAWWIGLPGKNCCRI